MAYFDMPLHELESYTPQQTSPPDFRQFWLDTLEEANRQSLDVHLEPLDHLPYINAHIYHASFASWNATRIVGIYVLPEGDGPFPALAVYHGYGSHRPDVFELLGWILQGYAVLAIDVRGQSGESGDGAGYPSGHVPGYLTMGISDPAYYYYRGAYIDALRAVDALAVHPQVDRNRIGITGASQGGGLALAAAALCGLSNRIALRAAVAEIPFLCHFERAATLMDSGPYPEIGSYCRRSGADVARVFRTLSYFDCMNLADAITAPTLVTSGLMDTICPPSTIFAAYNHIKAPKDIFVAPFGEHETFPGVYEARARWFKTHI